jgi:hypothetical protein
VSYQLKPCPPPGSGCHRWLYYAVCTLHRLGVSPTKVEAIVEPRMTREPQCNEIANTIANVYAGARCKPSRKLDWLGNADAAKMEATTREYRDISMRTWIDLSDQVRFQEEILRWAFKPSELICTGAVFDGRWNIVVLTLDQTIVAGPNRQFIVPSPFTSYRGTTKDGRTTNKSDGQVRFRRFVVVEFDLRGFAWLKTLPLKQKLDYQARLHWALSRRFPLALIVFSGSESLHGWYITRRPEQLMAEAVSIGGDPALWVPSQFTRMPGGRHANGNRQEVVYWKRGQLPRS